MLHKIVFPDVVFKGPPAPGSTDGALTDITPRVELLGLVSTVPPKGQTGFNIQDIRDRMKLLDQLEHAPDGDELTMSYVILDEPEYKILQAVMEASSWTSAGAASAAVKLADAVDNAEEIDPVEAVAKDVDGPPVPSP